MTDYELMQMALDALEGYARNCRCEGSGAPCDAAEALRARLAQPEPWTPDDTAYRPGGLAQPEPPCKTGSQCIGGKCLQCAQPEAEPVGWLYGIGDYAEFRRTKDGSGSAIRTPLYTAPPQRKEWQRLTDEEISDTQQQF